MKKTKEMIEVMEAYFRGEEIECKLFDVEDCGWAEMKEPQWDWFHIDYRVKPKKKYVPFDTAEEFLAAQRVHGNMIAGTGINKAYINSSCELVIISNGEIYDYLSLGDLHFEEYKFKDGTPCKKEVES